MSKAIFNTSIWDDELLRQDSGVNLTISCAISKAFKNQLQGKVKLEYAVNKGGNWRVPPSKETNRIVQEGEDFIISRLRIQDDGVYSCAAKINNITHYYEKGYLLVSKYTLNYIHIALLRERIPSLQGNLIRFMELKHCM